ncbi:low molecular weight protein tyrosine phosphatase [hydrocarbon metagenome]|uniref:Low molecular weight protein tyrosine phosphatase n=1 Tax=hydrocarbon metagenome TaxID=938273 RepID=A0A0W8E9V5_9ZZZZ
MAQGLFTRIIASCQGGGPGSDYEIWSAGIFAADGIPATREAIETMLQYEIDLSGHRSKRLDEEMIDNADLVLVMTREHYRYIVEMFGDSKGKTFLLSDLAGYDGLEIFDPYGLGMEAYQKSAGQIKEMLEKIIEKLAL